MDKMIGFKRNIRNLAKARKKTIAWREIKFIRDIFATLYISLASEYIKTLTKNPSL